MTRTLPLAALLLSLPLAAATPGTRTGAFAPGERVTPPAAHAPAAASRTFVKTVAPLAGAVSLEVPSTGSGSLLVVAVPAGAARGVAGALESPAGRRLAARESESGDLRRFDVAAEELGLDLPTGAAQVIHVEKAERGAYRLNAAVPSGTAAVTVIAAEPDSPLALSTWAGPLSRHAGEPIEFHAELSDGGAPVTGARVVARLAAPGAAAGAEIPLYDDGLHGDGGANDGVYASRVAGDDLQAGFVSARFDAEGRDAHGAAFLRTGSSGLVNEPALAALSGVRALFAEKGTLRVVATVDVAVAGDYRLDAIVSGAAAADGSRPGIAWGEKTLALGTGPQHVSLEIPAGDLGGADAAHVDVRLLGLTTLGVAGRVEVEAAR